MTLIKSISGMRGTIGGKAGENLTAIDIVEFSCAYAQLLIENGNTKKVVIGRDGRITGDTVQQLVTHSLILMGIDVLNVGLSTTPTVEMAVSQNHAGGGIIITASHNPKEWNALKFLNNKGEFISHEDGEKILQIAAKRSFHFAHVDQIGTVIHIENSIDDHVQSILDLKLVDAAAVRNKSFKVVVDCVNSTGAIALPILLDALGCQYVLINQEITGDFAHNPEPLEHNLTELSHAVKAHKADLGIAVDPDVDRLAFIDEKGIYCGEEYTLVMVAQWILENDPGSTVSNLSSTIVLRKITESKGLSYAAAAVGEVNVVQKMKDVHAVIGGEGNGGIIYPELHYGRDALVGVALLLTALVKKQSTLSKYRSTFPNYTITKNKIDLTDDIDVDHLLSKVKKHFEDFEIDDQDGVKIYFDEGWTHLRKSNTEAIIRLYAEAPSAQEADYLAERVMKVTSQILNL
jgi:phosphomannomutase